METSNITLKEDGASITIISDNDCKLALENSINDGILISASGQLNINLSLLSEDPKMWKSFLLFEDFMQKAVGKIVFSEVVAPEGFIDTQNKTFTIKDDNGASLVIVYQNSNITIKANSSEDFAVCIDHENSAYKAFLPEFSDLYYSFVSLMDILNTYDDNQKR